VAGFEDFREPVERAVHAHGRPLRPQLVVHRILGHEHSDSALAIAGLASGLIQTSQRLGFPLGLSLVLTVASTFDPQLGLTGFRYAFFGAAVLSAIGLGIALRFRGESLPAIVDEATPDLGPVGERGDVE